MSKNKLICPTIIILVIAGMYSCAVFFPFIGYDNNQFIIGNPLIGSWDWQNLIQIWEIGGVKHENLYIPLTYVTYYFETGLFGKKPFIIHLNNLLLHTANCILLFYFVKRIGLKPLYAFIASLAFALHPLQVEPVVWCMGRKDLLSTLFALLSMHSYLSYSSTRNVKWTIMTFLFGVSAMLAKPVMVILPGILILIEIFLLKSYEFENVDTAVSSLKKFSRKYLFNWKISANQDKEENRFVIRKFLVGLLGFYSLITLYFNLNGPFRASTTRSPYENFLCLIYLLTGWFKRFFMVDSLQHFYRPPSQSLLDTHAPEGYIILFLSAILTVYFIVHSKYDKKIIFGLFFFLIAFIPPLAHLSYSQDFITADRYGYFPLIGLFIALAAFYSITSKKIKTIFSIVFLVWFLLIFINNHAAVRSWSTDIKFWELEVKTKPESPVDNYFLGLSHQKMQNYDLAINSFGKCIEKENSYTHKALINIGTCYLNKQNYEQAEAFYNKSLNYRSDHLQLIYTNLAETYLRQKKVHSAINAFRKCFELETSQGKKHLLLARIHLYQMNRTLALEHAKEAAKYGVEWSSDLKVNLKDSGKQ